MKEKRFLVFDTETLKNLQSPYVFDFGAVVCNKRGEVLAEYQAVIRETVCNFRLIRDSIREGHPYIHKLFYSYIPKLAVGHIPLKTWDAVQREVNDLCDLWQVDCIAAYNLPFDRKAITHTKRHLRKSGQFFRRSMQTLDLWRFAELVTNCKAGHQYVKACAANGSITDKGNVQTSAQAVARYILGHWDLIEDHTALSDARLEAQIMARLFKHKQAVPYGVDGNKSISRKAQPCGWGSAKPYLEVSA